MNGPTQMLLSVYWEVDGGQDRHTRHDTVTMHVGDLANPLLTKREMQDIAYGAKMAFAKVMRARKKAK